MTRLLAPVIIALLLIAVSCSHEPLDVDISDVKTNELQLMRLDQDLFTLTDENIAEKTALLKKKYGDYYEHYLRGFIVRRGTQDTMYRQMVLSFVKDQNVRDCNRDVQAVFSQNKLEKLRNEVQLMVKRHKYHFPTLPLPSRLITCQSGWNYSFAYMDSALVLALDRYLGDTCRFYDMLQIPIYQQKMMSSHYILPDLARGWLLTEFDSANAENTLLHHTIFYGKLYYAVNALLPGTEDSLIISYTGQQLNYCRQYEKKLWSYFADKNRLYENNIQTIRELTSEGPFTSAISKDCPPRVAMWVGWQIVKSYMKNNEGVSLEQLMAEKDAQKILTKSRYRP
jgi:hypothetical protein